MSRDKREFARIEVSLAGGVRPVEAEAVEALRDELRIRPSVWAPTDETALREMVAGSTGTAEAVLAQAVLELSAQIVHLKSRMAKSETPSYHVEVVQLSGGGGQLRCSLPLTTGEFLELQFEDEDDDLPPIRALIEVVHHRTREPRGFGFRFNTIHRKDQDRLIRLIYRLQREALRRNSSRAG